MPKARTPSAYLSDHDTPEAAIEQAIADARSESAAARRFKRAYTPLVETLKLSPTIEDSDDAVSAARDAAKDALSAATTAEPDTDTLDTLRGLLDAYAEHTGIDLVTALEGLDEKATDEQVDALIAETFKPLTESQARVQTLEREVLAGQLKVSPDDLNDYLGNRQPVRRKVKAEDGTESEVAGIGEGDAWRPLSEVKAIQALAGATTTTAAKPEPKPLPVGGAGSKAAEVNPVAALNQSLFGSRKKE